MSDPVVYQRLLLPPPFVASAAGEGDILDLTCARAEDGAGTLLWRDADGVLAFGLVLEPAPPLTQSEADTDFGYYAALAALCDAVAQHGQPERQVHIQWPDRVIYDAGLLAGARWRIGPKGEDGLPLWAVFAAELTRARAGLEQSGDYPQSTSLDEEDFPDSAQLLESFAAFLKLIVDRWAQQGPDAVLRRMLNRVADQAALETAEIKAGRLHLPRLGNMLDEGGWRDSARGGPRW